jgi:hypothetical protein
VPSLAFGDRLGDPYKDSAGVEIHMMERAGYVQSTASFCIMSRALMHEIVMVDQAQSVRFLIMGEWVPCITGTGMAPNGEGHMMPKPAWS